VTTYHGRHTITCYWPGCDVQVTGEAQSEESQTDADNKAETSAKQSFEQAAHRHDEGGSSGSSDSGSGGGGGDRPPRDSGSPLRTHRW